MSIQKLLSIKWVFKEKEEQNNEIQIQPMEFKQPLVPNVFKLVELGLFSYGRSMSSNSLHIANGTIPKIISRFGLQDVMLKGFILFKRDWSIASQSMYDLRDGP